MNMAYLTCEQFIKLLQFRSFAHNALDLEFQRRRALSRFHILAAFTAFRAGHWADVRKHCALGILNDPSWLFHNQGVLSILVQSLLGRRAYHHLKRLGQRVSTIRSVREK